jgi:hypothetical protein
MIWNFAHKLLVYAILILKKKILVPSGQKTSAESLNITVSKQFDTFMENKA